LLPVALLGCAVEDGFSFSLCFGSYAYVIVLTNLLALGFDY